MNSNEICSKYFNIKIDKSKLLSNFGTIEHGSNENIEQGLVYHENLEEQEIKSDGEQDEDEYEEEDEDHNEEEYREQDPEEYEHQKEKKGYIKEEKISEDLMEKQIKGLNDEKERVFEGKNEKDEYIEREQKQQQKKIDRKLLIIDKLLKIIYQSFKDPKYSDLVFKIDDKHIFVNKFIIKMKCEYFDSKINISRDSDENEIEITEYSYDVYYAFLKYIYTDCIDIDSEKAMDLLILANDYKEEELKEKCLDVIKNNITIENVCSLCSSSIGKNLKEL